MNFENEFGIDAKKEAAIAEYFRKADKDIGVNSAVFDKLITFYIPTFGALNFAALEQIFRSNNFNTHYLAVPSVMIEAYSPTLLTVDPNAYVRDSKIVRRSIVAIGYDNLEKVTKAAAEDFGIKYDARRNLQVLRRAGIFTQRPGEFPARRENGISFIRTSPEAVFRFPPRPK